LVETIRAMLNDSKLSKSFWAEALSTATYLRNRSPTRAVQRMTPYEVWTGCKPNVSKLRVFGCDAYVHIPKDDRQKVDSNTKHCIFLGYGETTKVFRLYDKKKRRVFHSRDVVFNEAKTKIIQNNDVTHVEETIDQSVVDINYQQFNDETDDAELVEPQRSRREINPPDR